MSDFHSPGTVSRSVARTEIVAILHRYAYMAREKTNFTDMAVLFTTDGIFRLPNGHAVKSTEIAEVVKGQEAAFIRHHLTTSDITFVSDTEAKSVAYFFACTDSSSMDHWGYWEDVFKKDDHGRWLIADRQVMVEGSDPKGWFAKTYG